MRTRTCALLPLLIALATGCGLFRPDPAAAINVVSEMDRAVQRREERSRETLALLSAKWIAATESSLQASWRHRLSELKLEVWQQTDDKRRALAAFVSKRLEDALKGELERMHRELQAARNDPSPQRREREYQLAANLSATLASMEYEAGKLRLEADDQLRAVRKSALESIDQRIDRPPVGEVDLTAASAAITAGVGPQSDYAQGMARGAQELRAFLTSDTAFGHLLRGLLGDELGAMAATQLQTRINAKATDALSRMDVWVADQRASLKTSLSDASTVLLAPAGSP